MTFPNPSTALASVVVDELVRGGVGLVVIAPGSRSTALALASVGREELTVVVAIDERSAGFHALGWAKSNHRPAAVMTTSGTAVANLMPAVVEADLTGTPLIVVSSDRPWELRQVGANQAIHQTSIFDPFVRASHELGPAEVHPQAPRWWRSMVSQVMAAAAGYASRPGPAHLNLGFREPTVPVTDDGRTTDSVYPFSDPGRPDLRPWARPLSARAPSRAAIGELASAMGGASRGVVVAGGGVDGSGEVMELGAHLGWPVLASADSGLRRPGAEVVTVGHHLAGRHAPDFILRFGTTGPSQRVVGLLSSDIPQAVVSPNWSDPGRQAIYLLDSDPAATAAALAETLAPGEPNDWARWWKEANDAVAGALSTEMGGSLSEPVTAARAAASGAGLLVVASSMPIRDLEAYASIVPPMVANRGASGIDGFVSTALGAAHGSPRALALTGDLSLLHDANGFLSEPRPDCVFVVVDNGGGGIFSFLPQAEHTGEHFERLFATPHGRDLGLLAELHGLSHVRVETTAALDGAIEEAWGRSGISLVVVGSDRADNVAEHSRLARVVDDAMASVTSPQD